jgi:hypothetical protein
MKKAPNLLLPPFYDIYYFALLKELFKHHTRTKKEHCKAPRQVSNGAYGPVHRFLLRGKLDFFV